MYPVIVDVAERLTMSKTRCGVLPFILIFVGLLLWRRDPLPEPLWDKWVCYAFWTEPPAQWAIDTAVELEQEYQREMKEWSVGITP